MRSVLKLLLIGVMVICPTMVHAESLDIHSEEVKQLLNKNKLEESGLFETGQYIFGLGVKKKIDVNSISEKDAASLVTSVVEGSKIQHNQIGPDDFNDWMRITSDTYKTAFKYVFGPDVSLIQYKEQDKIDGSACYTFTYDSTKDNYYTATRCGGTGTKLNSFIVSVSKSTDGNYITMHMKPYTVYTFTNKIANLTSTDENDAISVSSIKIDTIKTNYADYIDTYQLSFKKASDSNYYIYSVENLKDAKEYKDSSTTNKTKVSKAETNPKTSDVNVFEYIGIVLCAITILGISIKKVKALK